MMRRMHATSACELYLNDLHAVEISNEHAQNFAADTRLRCPPRTALRYLATSSSVCHASVACVFDSSATTHVDRSLFTVII
jgi:hypothetical protein